MDREGSGDLNRRIANPPQVEDAGSGRKGESVIRGKRREEINGREDERKRRRGK